MNFEMKRLFSLVLVVLLGAPSVLAADFSDVADNYRYRYGVNYLFDNDIVEGYPDGTFRPTEDINRAELTKIVVESVGLDLIQPNGCFPDVPNDQWYATYVCTAKDAGWIEGYPDGTFQPARTINRAESVKIIAEAEQWDLPTEFEEPFSDTSSDQWYTKYVSYANERSFLPFNSRFNAGTDIERGEFSEIYYRVLYTRNESLTEFVSPNDEDANEEVVVEEPESEEIEVTDTVEVDLGSLSYDAGVFDKIELDSDFPKTFFKDEVYRFEGRITSGSYDSLFVFTYPESDSTAVKTFSGDVQGDRFSIPMYFDENDDYVLGIIPGTSGVSKIAIVEVEDLPPRDDSLAAPNAPSALDVNFDGDLTSATYSSDGAISRLTFSQGSDSVSYLSRQSGNEIALRYSDFEEFNEGTVSWKVETANTDDLNPFNSLSDWVSSSSKNISATQHYYAELENTISLDSLPDFHFPNESITLSGQTSVDLSSDFYAILPNGLVYSDKSSGTISAGSSFSFDYTFDQSGTHILEINDTKGLAVLNHPVYEEGKIPLIPDYFDINKLELRPSDPFNATSEAEDLFNLINSERSKYGLSAVSLDAELSGLALGHSADMKASNFFAHVNPAGETPNDRRVAAGIETLVGENIAKSVGTRFAHEALMRSAVHRANILNPSWSRVGIGITRNSEGYFYVSQEFSFELEGLVDQFKDSFDDRRSSDFVTNSSLVQASEEWLQIMLDEDVFSTEHNGDRIFDHVPDGHGLVEFKALILAGGNVYDMTNLGVSSSDIEDDQWTDIGFALSITDEGAIYLVALYAR